MVLIYLHAAFHASIVAREKKSDSLVVKKVEKQKTLLEKAVQSTWSYLQHIIHYYLVTCALCFYLLTTSQLLSVSAL